MERNTLWYFYSQGNAMIVDFDSKVYLNELYFIWHGNSGPKS